MKISVITATYNAAQMLSELIKSLQLQTDPDFEWVVVDGQSSDESVELVKQADNLNLQLISEPDFGIYDALNKGIKLASGDYYLVVGADDTLEQDAIANYKQAIECSNDQADIIAAVVRIGGSLMRPRSNKGWLYGMQGIASCHSVGLLINRSLHQRFGDYSNKYPIAADQLFVKSAYNGGAVIQRESFIAGRFSVEGISASDHLGMLTELFRVQMETEKSKSLQVLLFFCRLIKNLPRLLR